jgi:hypothetical protein
MERTARLAWAWIDIKNAEREARANYFWLMIPLPGSAQLIPLSANNSSLPPTGAFFMERTTRLGWAGIDMKNAEREARANYFRLMIPSQDQRS